MKPIHDFKDCLKKNWKSSIVHEKKRFENEFSFSLKKCVTEGKCDTLGMSKICHIGIVYCIRYSKVFNVPDEAKYGSIFNGLFINY